ncbi:MAG TPA: serine/threonine-protein kinase [Planctomycetota bacterium]|nr:serine/threonine-protein kinase [Planctomycetota bacterium]
MTDDVAPADGASTPSERLRDLLAECIERVAADGMAGAEAVLTANPEHAPALRQRLLKLQRTGLLPEQEPTPPAIPERLGEFRLLRRLGSGGMGVVFLAVQEPLNREVALKLVRPEQLFFPGARERFQREVEAIARLADPGIVPIYTVGEEGGIPFFAMEHIHGATLADVVADRQGRSASALSGRDLLATAAARAGVAPGNPMPELFAGSWVQTCCRIVQRMALAMDHAHARGVLHRDLKPSNAMVTPSGRVLLLDFGLAATAGTSRLTRSGAQLGTLHYMAPEQLRGEALDARTDVYALGVSLYELLTLAAPYHDDGSERLRQAILAGVLPSPRRRNAAIPVDVDTICRCALDRDLHRRYPTAAALAADLGRFLEHRPIRARPSGQMLRLRRWARRHPAWATTTMLLAALAIGAPLLLQQLQRSVTSAQETATANLKQALSAIGQLLQQTTDQRLVDTPGFDRPRAEQLDRAVVMLQQLRRENDGSWKVRYALATGLMQAAGVRQALGQVELAEQAFGWAQAEFERLQTEQPANMRLLLDRASLALNRGNNCRLRGDLSAAAAQWQHGVQLLHGPAETASAAPQLLSVLSGCQVNLAMLHQARGDLEAAETELRQALALDGRAGAAGRDGGAERAKTRIDLAFVLRRRNHLQPALDEYTAVQDDLRALLATSPNAPELRRELARALTGGAMVQGQLGRHAAAWATHAEALATYQRLVTDFPDRMPYARERALVELDGSDLALALDDDGGAEALLRAAVAHHEQLVRRDGTQPEIRGELASMIGKLARLLGRGEHDEEVEPLLQRAIALQAAVTAELPSDSFHLLRLGLLRTTLGMHHLGLGASDTAQRELTTAVQALEAALAAGRADVAQKDNLPNTLLVQMHAAAAAGDPTTAVQALQRRQQLVPERRAALQELGARLHLQARADFQAVVAAAPE